MRRTGKSCVGAACAAASARADTMKPAPSRLRIAALVSLLVFLASNLPTLADIAGRTPQSSVPETHIAMSSASRVDAIP